MAIYTVAMFVAIYTAAMAVTGHSDKVRAGRPGNRGFDSQRILYFTETVLRATQPRSKAARA